MVIALDLANDGVNGTGVTSITRSHACTGTNLLLLVGIVITTQNSDVLTGITYNSEALTFINKKQTTPSDLRWTYLYYLLSPASGTHDIVASFSSSINATLLAVSYSGVSQSSFPDNSGTFSKTSPCLDTLTSTLTTTADNCWLAQVCRNASQGQKAGSNTTLRNTVSIFSRMSDTNAAQTPAGSKSLNVGNTIDDLNLEAAAVTISFAPAGATTATGFMSTMRGYW